MQRLKYFLQTYSNFTRVVFISELFRSMAEVNLPPEPPVLSKTSQASNFRWRNENEMSRIMRKPDFCLYENKGTDQLCSNCEADQCLFFHYTYSSTPLLPISKISSFQPSSVLVQLGSCQTWSETPKTGFLTPRLKLTRQ